MHDLKISPASMAQFHAWIDQYGWPKATLDLFDSEIHLAQHIADEAAKMHVRLTRAGLSKEQVAALMPHLARLVLEPLLMLDHGHRHLWEGFLPHPDTAARYVQPGRHGEPRPRAFAQVSLSALDVQALRPQWSEWQSMLFLMRDELELSGAMATAGRAKLRSLLEGQDRTSGGRP